MAFSTINKSSLYQNTVLYTGNGSARTITGVGFQPDWVWVKDRSTTNSHYLYDAVRGNNLNLFSNDSAAEVNVTTGQNGGGIGSQASDGFNIVAGTSNTNNVNTNSNLYASWNWKANGAGSSNTDGSITSTVSANTISGFSIVKFTGTGSNATVGHGLGAIPQMIIVKSLDNTRSWVVYNSNIANTEYLYLNVTNAKATDSTQWNSATPTSTYFSVGSASESNESGQERIAYCFTDVSGYSKFGIYIGNGSTDGTFVYTGFKPTWLMWKNTGATEDWTITDNKRSPDNVCQEILMANATNAESGGNSSYVDFLSNGFKLRGTDARNNASSNNYIYAAFGQPIISNGGVCATAR